MQISIRQAGREDLPRILDIYKELESDAGEVLTLSQADTLFDRISAYPNYKIYVAVFDDEIVGTFALAIMDNLAHKGSPSGLIEDVAVKSSWRGKGVGKQMMGFAMERCRENGCYKAALSSNKKEQTPTGFMKRWGLKSTATAF